MPKKTLLIVDAQRIIREPLAAAIQAAGYLTLSAGDGAEAVEMANECDVSLFVFDLALPNVNGVEMLRRLRAMPRYAKVPGILLIDGLDLQAVKQAVEMGIRDYMVKSSFCYEKLLTTIARHVPPHIETPPAAPPQPPKPQPIATPPAAPAKPTPPPAPMVISQISAEIDESAVLKSIKPVVTREQIDEIIATADDLPILASSQHQLKSLVTEGVGSLDDAVHIARRDPMLALRLLRAAHGERFKPTEALGSIHTAMARLGMQEIGEIVNTAPTCVVPAESLPHIDGLAWWQHSVAVAHLAAEFTRLQSTNAEEIDEAYTAGLVHDVGRMVLGLRLKEEYAEVLETAVGLGVSTLAAEAHMLLENHATLVEKALGQWGCPSEMVNAVGLHHTDPAKARRLAGRAHRTLQLINLSNAVAHCQLYGYRNDDTIQPTDTMINALQISPTRLIELFDALPDAVNAVTAEAFPAAQLAGKVTRRQRQLDQLQPAPRIAYLSSDPDGDNLALMARAINPNPQKLKPNFAVVYLRSVRDRAALSERLKRLEVESGLPTLPTIVVSHKGNIALSDAAIKGRNMVMMPQPIESAEFLRNVRKLATSMSKAA